MEKKWESFCDEGYYGLWAVRPVGDRSFKSQQLFHVQSKAESDALRETLDTITRQLEAAVEGLERLGTCYCMDNFECDMHRTLAKIKQIGEEQ
jgi:hypothetical protein